MRQPAPIVNPGPATSRCYRGCSAVVAAVALAGCGGAKDTKESVGARRMSLPACAGADASVPSGLPASFPLPAGAVVRSSRNQHTLGRTFRVVSARTPGTIEDALAYLRGLPKAGFRITDSDSEESEAEASFAGRGVQGRLRFRSLPHCAGALTLDVATTAR